MWNTLYHYYHQHHLLYNNDHASKTSTTHDNTMDQFELQQVKGIVEEHHSTAVLQQKIPINTGCAPSGLWKFRRMADKVGRSTVLIWNSHILRMGSIISSDGSGPKSTGPGPKSMGPGRARALKVWLSGRARV